MARAKLQTRTKTNTDRQRRRFAWGDLVAGLSVALIAVPQTLAYADLAGMPAYTGIYALATSAIAAAFFASSPYLQTGPAAITAILTLGILTPLAVPGSPEFIALAGALALVVGGVRVLVGLLRLGAVAYLMSQPLLKGFMTAAALLIVLSQLPGALGLGTVSGNVLPSTLQVLSRPQDWHWAAVGLTAATVLLVRFGSRVHPLFPGVLVAVGLGILFSLLSDYAGPVVGSVQPSFPSLQLEQPWAALPDLLVGGLVIAFVGFAEAASIARTYATRQRRVWHADREFISQGVANLAAGFFGGFPVGGSFGRSSVNYLAGARTRWSGLVTGLAVLAFVPLMGLVSPLPKAVLSGIIIAAVLPLVRLDELYELRRYSKPQTILAWLTFALTLALAPRIDYAVSIGVSAALLIHLWREQNIVIDYWIDDGTVHVKPMGVLWFGSIFQLDRTLDRVLADFPTAEALWLHLGGLGRIDLSGALTIRRLLEDATASGLAVMVLDVPPGARKWMRNLLAHEGKKGT